MKKIIAITGTSRGIGKAIYNQLKKDGLNTSNPYEIIKLGRQTGFDIQKDWKPKLSEIVDKTNIFINNVHYQYEQIKILQYLYNEWRAKDNKMIINISSTAGDKKQERFGVWASYQVQKIALDEACKQLEGMGKCKVVNIRPGWVNTKAVEGIQKPIGITLLQPETVAQIISYIINQPEEIYIKNISIEPWYKKSK